MENPTDMTAAPKRRNAELIKPPNTIKQKVGTGGLDQQVIERAQKSLDHHNIDFIPIASGLIDDLDAAISSTRDGRLNGEAAIEAIIYPAMQIKAQGAMLHYALATDISDILVNFLETVSAADKDVLDIAEAHKKTLHLIITKHMRENKGVMAEQLRQALIDACNRYYKHHP